MIVCGFCASPSTYAFSHINEILVTCKLGTAFLHAKSPNLCSVILLFQQVFIMHFHYLILLFFSLQYFYYFQLKFFCYTLIVLTSPV